MATPITIEEEAYLQHVPVLIVVGLETVQKFIDPTECFDLLCLMEIPNALAQLSEMMPPPSCAALHADIIDALKNVHLFILNVLTRNGKDAMDALGNAEEDMRIISYELTRLARRVTVDGSL